MGPSSISGHSPTPIVCSCLRHWVKSQTAPRCSVSCPGWMIWEAPGHPAAPPSATIPKNRDNDLMVNSEKILISVRCWLSLPVPVCDHSSLPPPWHRGGRAALLSPKRNTLENTPHTLYTRSSAPPGTAVGETPPGERGHSLIFHHVTYFCASVTATFSPVAAPDGFCSSASVLSCVQVCSWTNQWPSASLDHATPPATPNSWLCCLEIKRNAGPSAKHVLFKTHFTGNECNADAQLTWQPGLCWSDTCTPCVPGQWIR